MAVPRSMRTRPVELTHNVGEKSTWTGTPVLDVSIEYVPEPPMPRSRLSIGPPWILAYYGSRDLQSKRHTPCSEQTVRSSHWLPSLQDYCLRQRLALAQPLRRLTRQADDCITKPEDFADRLQNSNDLVGNSRDPDHAAHKPTAAAEQPPWLS